MGSQYQRSVPLEVRRAEGERVRAKHPDKLPVSKTDHSSTTLQSIDLMLLIGISFSLSLK